MPTIRELLREIHRRSLWQILLIYLGGSWAALEFVDWIAERLLLPDWIPGLALVLLVVGLPFVLATAFVQEGGAAVAPDDATSPTATDEPGTTSGPTPAPSEPSGQIQTGSPTHPAGARAADRASGAPGRVRRLLTWRHAIEGGVTALALWGVVVTGWLVFADRDDAETEPLPAGSAIAVLPPTPAVEDTALRRLGRELTITLSSNLDGVADLRAADPLSVLALVERDAEPLTLERATRLATLLRATNLIHGSLVRAGEDVRVDLGLYRTGDREPVARVTATGAPERITALTDSTTLGLLRGLGRAGDLPTANPVAITTRSLPALRAYLEGEQAIVNDHWRAAADAFARAIEADSTFWFAYWRYLVARWYWELPVDSSVVAAVVEHRDELPERDRSLVEARMAETASADLALTRQSAERFPDYWVAWFELTETLIHSTPYLGTTYADSREAAERTVELNPEFVTGWEHLIWITVFQRDSAASARALREIRRRFAGQEQGPSPIPLYAYLIRLIGTEGAPDSAHSMPGARELAGLRGGVNRQQLFAGLHAFGFPRATLDLAERIRRVTDRPEVVAASWYASSVARAARGAWDSALVAADRYTRDRADAESALHAYRLAAVGAALGAVDPAAASVRAVPARRAGPESERETRGELAWLDGLVAYATGDAIGLASARDSLRASGDRHAETLDRSLAGLSRALEGDHTAAARTLADLEEENAERARQFSYGDRHPWLNGIDRLLAARWLLADGDTARAQGLLTWYEAVFPPLLALLSNANRTFEALAHFERARIQGGRGTAERAARHYRRFLARYDAPDPELRGLVEAARAGLARLGTEGSR